MPTLSRSLIGRASELEQMLGALESARHATVVALVTGEASIGKSSLVTAFLTEARGRGARVLAGSCISTATSGIAYAPLVDAMVGMLRDDASAADAWAPAVRGALAPLLPGAGLESALMARLAPDGAAYEVVKTEDEFSSIVVAPLLPPGLSFLDRDLLLARVAPAVQLSLSTPVAAHFSTLLQLPLGPGLGVPIQRGWISVDATIRGRTARVIATHLESFYEPVQEAQAMELAGGPAATSRPVIVAGDLNTGPGSAQHQSYDWLVNPAGSGFVDTWSATRPGENGFTDAYYTEDPPTPAVPSERIDLVLVRGATVPAAPKDYLVGTELPHPSDHAGVVAKVTIPT